MERTNVYEIGLSVYTSGKCNVIFSMSVFSYFLTIIQYDSSYLFIMFSISLINVRHIIQYQNFKSITSKFRMLVQKYIQTYASCHPH